MLVVALRVDAYSTTDDDGNTWYFAVLSGTNVVITNSSESNSSAKSGSYTNSTVSIPSTLTYSGTTYTVTAIGYAAFYGCTKVTTIEIPATLDTIYSYAFRNCTALTKFVVDEENEKYWTSSDGSILYTNTPLLSTPSGYSPKVLDKAAPGYSWGSYEIAATDSVTEIGRDAFSYCTTLTSITIPNSVYVVQPQAFQGCTNLTTVTFSDDGNTKYIQGSAFYNCTALTKVTLPSTLTTLYAYAFRSCTSLTDIALPSSLKYIYGGVFYSCTALTSITIPASVKRMYADGTFRYCSSLASVTFEEGSQLTDSLGMNAFANCTSLKEIEIPAGVTKVGVQAFYGCTALERVAFAEGSECTYIGNTSFYQCTSLSYAEIPAKVTSIGKWAFGYCTGLDTLKCYADSVPETLSTYTFYRAGGTSSSASTTKVFVPPYSLSKYTAATGSDSYSWNWFSDDKYYPFYDLSVSSSGYAPLVLPFDATIPEGVTAYTVTAATESAQSSAYAAASSSSLTATLTEVESDTLEAGTSVLIAAAEGTYTFFGTEGDTTSVASQDTEIDATEDLTGTYASAGTTVSSGYVWSDDDVAFVAVTEETTVGQFEVYIAESISGIAEVVVEEESVLWYYVYNSDGTSVTITSSSESLTSTTAKSYTQSSLEVPTKITDDTGTYTVTGIGFGAFYGCTALEDITIPTTITSIGSRAFTNCTSLTKFNLKEGNEAYTLSADSTIIYTINVDTLLCAAPGATYDGYEIANTVTTIGEYAFYNCPYLKTITLDDALETIDNYAFRSCSALTTMKFDDALTTIGNYAFYGCSALTTITLDDALTTIGVAAFYNCSALTAAEIPASVTTIGNYAFQNSTSLASVTFADNSSLKTIGTQAFTYCTALKSIAIPTGATDWGSGFNFYGCTALTSATLPSDLTTVAYAAFYGCTALENVEIPSTVTLIDDYAFASCTSFTAVEIPAAVETIGSAAFQSCKNVASITFAEDAALTTIEDFAFYHNEKVTSLVVPASVVEIQKYAFQALNDCESISFGSGSKLTTIDTCAFYWCPNLKTLEIPANVTTIGYCAFYDAFALETIKCYATAVPYAYSAFAAWSNETTCYDLPDVKVYVLPYLLATYMDTIDVQTEGAEGWDKFAKTQYYPFYDLTVSSAKMATLALPFTSTIPDEVSCYTLGVDTVSTDKDKGVAYVSATEVATTLDKDTPVLVEGDAGTYCFYGTEDATVDGVVAAQTASVPQDGNGLVGTYEATTIYQTTTDDGNTYYNYVLQNQSGNVRFYQVGESGKSVGQFRAWLQLEEDLLNSDSGTTSIAFVFNSSDEVTGISEAATTTTAPTGIYYDLQGRAVKSPQKGGIYIHDGRKVIL